MLAVFREIPQLLSNLITFIDFIFYRTFTDKPVTCGASVQEPPSPTQTVCACPSDILLLTLSGGDSPCGSYVGSQGSLLVITNECPKPESTADAKVKRDDALIRERHPEITAAPAMAPVGAKFRPRPRAAIVNLKPRQEAPEGEVNLLIKGILPCLGPAEPSATGDAASGDPRIASLCSENKITPDIEAWKTYEVPSYMASLLTAAQEPQATPTIPVDGVAVIHDDVNPPGPQCTYRSKCESISCSDVKDSGTGTQLSIQRYLGYQAVVNLNNYLYSIYDAILDASALSNLMSPNLVKIYFTNPTPDASWQQIMGIFTGIFGLISGIFAPISAVGSGIAGGVAGSLAGISAAGTAAAVKPVIDARFDEYGNITQFIAEYLKATITGIEYAYNRSIGPETYAFQWAGSDLLPADQKNGIFGEGSFADADYSQDMTNQLLQKVVRIFSYKAINFAWTDSGVFIMYVPYGRDVKGPDGNMITGGINEDYCNNQLDIKEDIGTLTICDAPGGMARIFNAGNTPGTGDLLESRPSGFDVEVEILPNEPFSIADAIKGSIASWQVGDFGFDATLPYEDAFQSESGLDSEQAEEVARLPIQEETAGFFNLPVCQVLDLRFFPPASGKGCSACGSKAAVGGTQGSTKKFTDNIGETIKNLLQGPPNQIECGGYYGNSCARECPQDAYSG